MTTDRTPTTQGRHQHVVMLVDNGVNGDSRVQKVARSAADAGWDVTLVGLSPDTQEHHWQIGAAKVRLIPVPRKLSSRGYQFRRPWLRSPLAYKPGGVAQYRVQRINAWRADLAVRDLELRATPSGAPTSRRLLLRGELFAAQVLGRWVKLRDQQLRKAWQRRRRFNGRRDMVAMRFWQAVLKDKAWRWLEPPLWDWELAYAPVVDELRPDLIHAHDFRMVGVGARATMRARAAGRNVKLVWDAHEFLPGLKPRRNDVRWMPAHVAYEREHSQYADAVITVSDELAELLQAQHNLTDRPAVVLNAPGEDDSTPPPGSPPGPDLRKLCGVGASTKLAVYSGAAAPQRGLDIMVEALPRMPDLHAAFVVNVPQGPYLQSLIARAEELGVADRMHVLPYVSHWQVVPFLAGADVGVIPIHHWPNHEIALITKFFEYSHARLPLVVSDVRTMAATVRASGQGEVFTAEDTADYVRAVRAVLADPERYRSAYDKPGLLDGWTWQAQAETIDAVYRSLVERPQGAPAARITSPSAALTA
jgi:glycosyltransferase involved in cell wall biosynthesis